MVNLANVGKRGMLVQLATGPVDCIIENRFNSPILFSGDTDELDIDDVENVDDIGLKLDGCSPSFNASISDATLSTGESGVVG